MLWQAPGLPTCVRLSSKLFVVGIIIERFMGEGRKLAVFICSLNKPIHSWNLSDQTYVASQFKKPGYHAWFDILVCLTLDNKP